MINFFCVINIVKINLNQKKKRRGLPHKIIKNAIIPAAATVLTGGAVGPAFIGSAAATVATDKNKNPLVKTIVGTAISGSITKSPNLAKDITRAAVANQVTRKSKDQVIGAIAGSIVANDYQKPSDLLFYATGQIVKKCNQKNRKR